MFHIFHNFVYQKVFQSKVRTDAYASDQDSKLEHDLNERGTRLNTEKAKSSKIIVTKSFIFVQQNREILHFIRKVYGRFTEGLADRIETPS